MEIVPIQFLKAILPNPGELGENYTGETSIGCRIRGIKDGKEKTYYVWNNCSHQAAYQETGAQGVSYTTGVPATIGAMMFFKGLWRRPGVYNVEEFDPDPFMEELNKQGLLGTKSTTATSNSNFFGLSAEDTTHFRRSFVELTSMRRVYI